MNAPAPVADLLKNTKPDPRKQITLTKPIHCIVVIHGRVPAPRDVCYQVTLDPCKLSPNKSHIRLGDIRGDEFTGWVPSGDVEIREVLGTFEDNEPVPYHDTQQWNAQ